MHFANGWHSPGAGVGLWASVMVDINWQLCTFQSLVEDKAVRDSLDQVDGDWKGHSK